MAVSNGFQLGTAWIQISPSMRGFKKEVLKELGETSEPAKKQIHTGLGNAFKKVGKIGVSAIAGVGTAIAGIAIHGGISRALAIEQARAKLAGLGNDAKGVDKIMQNALASVKGTAFSLGDAATVAASLSASGIKAGSDLENSLKTTADVAQITGKSLTDVGAIFGSVAARGKLQGDDMLQLTSAGLPVLALLGKHLGKTTTEISGMVSKGQIDFATFRDAMQEGIGGAALKAGATFKGAWANLKAALGRVGEQMMGPVLNATRDTMNALIPLVDVAATKATPVFEAFGKKLGETAAWFTRLVTAIVQGKPSAEFAWLPGVIAGVKNLALGVKALVEFLSPFAGGIALVAFKVLSLVGALLQTRYGLLAVASGFATVGAVYAGIKITKYISDTSKAIKAAVTRFKDLHWAKITDAADTARLRAMYAWDWIAVHARSVWATTRRYWQLTAAKVKDTAVTVANKAATLGAAGAQRVLNMVVKKSPLFILAGVLIAVGAALYKFFTATEQGRAALGQMKQALTTVLQALAPIGNAFTSAFSGAAGKAGGIISSIGDSIASLVTSAAPLLTSLVSTLSGLFSSLMGALAPTLAQVGQIFSTMMANLAPILEQTFATLTPVLGQVGQIFGQALGQIMGALAPILPILAQSFAQISAALAPLIPQVIGQLLPAFSQLAGTVGTLLAQTIGTIAGALAGLVQQIAPLIAQLVTTLIPVIGQILQVVAMILPVIAGVVVLVVAKILPIIAQLVAAIIPLVTQILPMIAQVIALLVPIIAQIIAAVAPVIAMIISVLIPVIQAVMNIVVSVISAIVPIIQAAITIITGIIQVFSAILSGNWSLLWQGIKNVLSGVWGAIKSIVTGAINIVRSVISNVGAAISGIWTTLWGGIKSIASGAANWVKSTVTSIFNGLKNGVISAFEGMKNGIKTAWDKVKEIAAAPVRFVVNTVYNNGLRSWVNKATSAIGLKGVSLPYVKLGFAGGGQVPGYAPGRDTIPAMLSPGEFVLVPEAARAIGYRNLYGINAAYTSRKPSGGQHFAGGGLAGAWSTLKDWGSRAADFFADPIGSFLSAVTAPARALLNRIPGGIVGQMGTGIVNSLLEKLSGWFKGKAEAANPGGGLVSQAMVAVARKIPYVWGGTTDAGLDCSGLVYWSAKRAGFGWPRLTAAGYQSASRKVSSPIPGALIFWGNPAHHVAISAGGGYLIEEPKPGLFARKIGMRGNSGYGIYGGKGTGATAAGLNREGRAHKYDSGGFLQPGLTTVLNMTGKPEAVLTDRQWRVLSESGNRGGDVYNIHAPDHASAEEIIDRAMLAKRFRHYLGGEISYAV